MTTTPKTLAAMTAEIVENNTRLGWYENCATFPEAMALLHSEVSEALEAWRVWGVQDGTYHVSAVNYLAGKSPVNGGPPKPEGVGSEFADIFIRLLDDAWLFGAKTTASPDGIDLEVEASRSAGRFGISTSFGANMNALHGLIAHASFAWEAGDAFAGFFGQILVFLCQLCAHYGIDLMAEYERKVAYNRTRPYRHGGKAI